MKQILILLAAIVCLSLGNVNAQKNKSCRFIIYPVANSENPKILPFMLVGNVLENGLQLYEYFAYDLDANFRLLWQQPCLSIKDNGNDVLKMDNFNLRQLFGNMSLGLRFGCEWSYTKLYPYISLKYGWQNFDTKFHTDGETHNHKIRKVIPGLGVKIPFDNVKRSLGWAPYIMLGLDYNIITKYKKGIYGRDKNQLNNTITTCYDVGARYKNFGFEFIYHINHDNLFNTSYTPDDGLNYPFAQVETMSKYIGIEISYTLRHK